jgi:hypothetical protein
MAWLKEAFPGRFFSGKIFFFSNSLPSPGFIYGRTERQKQVDLWWIKWYGRDMSKISKILQAIPLRRIRQIGSGVEDFYRSHTPPIPSNTSVGDLFHAAYAEDEASLADLTPYRHRMAWRITRHLLAPITAPLQDVPAERLEPPPQEDLPNLVKLLNLHEGTLKDPHAGRYGLYGLLTSENSELYTIAYPTREDLLHYEARLVEECYNILIEKSVIGLEQHIKLNYNFNTAENTLLCQFASQRSQFRLNYSLEQEKAMILTRLENIANKAQQSLDIRAELAALKVHAVITGLGKVDPPDEMTTIIDAIESVSLEEDRKARITYEEEN